MHRLHIKFLERYSKLLTTLIFVLICTFSLFQLVYILLEQRGSFCIFHIEPLLPTQSQIQSSRLSLVDSVRAKSFSSLPGDAPGQLSPSIPHQSVLGTRDSSSLALRGLGDTGPSVASRSTDRPGLCRWCVSSRPHLRAEHPRPLGSAHAASS